MHRLSLFVLGGTSFSGSVPLKWTQWAAEPVTHRKQTGIVLKGAERCLLRLPRAGLWPQLSRLRAPVSDAHYCPAPRSKGNVYTVIFFWLTLWTLSGISQTRFFREEFFGVFSASSLWLPSHKTHVNCAPKYENVNHVKADWITTPIHICACVYILYACITNDNKSDFIFTFIHFKSVRLKSQFHILAEFSVGWMSVSYSPLGNTAR